MDTSIYVCTVAHTAFTIQVHNMYTNELQKGFEIKISLLSVSSIPVGIINMVYVYIRDHLRNTVSVFCEIFKCMQEVFLMRL